MSSSANGARDRAPRRRPTLVLALCAILAGAYAIPMKLGVVCGESMSPTLHHGQLFLMRRARRGGRLRRGDVIVYEVQGRQYVKRVYALPGDTVSGIDWPETDGHPDYVATDREMHILPELVRRRPGVGEFVRMTVPPDHVFVLGDATSRSYDSRHFGPIPMQKVKGRLLATLFTIPKARRTYTTAMALEIEGRASPDAAAEAWRSKEPRSPPRRAPRRVGTYVYADGPPTADVAPRPAAPSGTGGIEASPTPPLRASVLARSAPPRSSEGPSSPECARFLTAWAHPRGSPE